jgi:ribosomal protein L7Ae-like RNA K-turn-binding protein
MKSGKLSFGFNNCIYDIKKDKCKFVIIAEDASDNTKDKLVSLCKAKELSYKIYGNKNEFGLRIGKSPKSVLAIKDENMSKVVQDMLV